MRHLVLSFCTILRRGTVGTLKRWIKETEKAGITAVGLPLAALIKGGLGDRIVVHRNEAPAPRHHLRAARARAKEETAGWNCL
jgi:hypothetical protein